MEEEKPKEIALLFNVPLELYLKLLEVKKTKNYKSWKQMMQEECLDE